MARADFNWIPFTHTFTANDPSFSAEFRIEGDPIDDAIMVIRTGGDDFTTRDVVVHWRE